MRPLEQLEIVNIVYMNEKELVANSELAGKLVKFFTELERTNKLPTEMPEFVKNPPTVISEANYNMVASIRDSYGIFG